MRALLSLAARSRRATALSELACVARWWRHVAAVTARDLWDGLPGPWPVKVLLVVVTQAIPGPQDELLLLAVVALWRKYRANLLDTRDG
jgi:hypothetical protein